MKHTSKKILGVILAAAMLFGSLAAMSSAAINGHKISVSDARTVLRAAVNLAPVSGNDKKLADMDFDSVISVSDARAMLRIAVSLDIIDGETYNNEYELLSSGHYSFTGTYTEGSGSNKTTGKLSMVVTPNTLKMDIAGMFAAAGGDMAELKEMLDMFGSDFELSAILFANNKISILSENTKESVSVSEKAFGDDFAKLKDEMKQFIPNVHTSLSQANSTKTASFNGKSCTVYTFNETDTSGAKYTSNVYMNGNKLMKIDYANNSGTVIRSIVFDSFSRLVAKADTNINGYDDTDITKLISGK